MKSVMFFFFYLSLVFTSKTRDGENETCVSHQPGAFEPSRSDTMHSLTQPWGHLPQGDLARIKKANQFDSCCKRVSTFTKLYSKFYWDRMVPADQYKYFVINDPFVSVEEESANLLSRSHSVRECRTK